MQKEEVRNRALQEMTLIENHFPDHVPRPVIAYYLLLSAIYTADLNAFFAQHGWVEIDAEDAEIGKEEYLRQGRLNQFEHEVIQLINNETRKREYRAKPISLSHYRFG